MLLYNILNVYDTIRRFKRKSLYVQVNGTVEKLHYGECNIMRSVTNNSMYINSIIGKRSA